MSTDLMAGHAGALQRVASLGAARAWRELARFPRLAPLRRNARPIGGSHRQLAACKEYPYRLVDPDHGFITLFRIEEKAYRVFERLDRASTLTTPEFPEVSISLETIFRAL